MRLIVLLLAVACSVSFAQPAAETAPVSGDAPPPLEQPAVPPASEPTPVPLADPAPQPQSAPAAVPKPAAKAPKAESEQQRFEQYRRDLVSLLALRAEPDLLVAAAELAYPDTQDKTRAAQLKSPSLIKRAQKFGPDDALVWWVATFIECATDAAHCHTGEAAAKLQQIAADNAAVWLPSLHAAKDPAKARELLATMAKAKSFDDYWSAGVLALYRAVQVLPVPPEVLGHGINSTAARINLATSVGSAFAPNYARLGDMCRRGDAADEALISDCLAVARLLENGGSFRSQSIALAIEDALLPPGTARDVLRVRQRSAGWQKQAFLELSGRFPRDETLAQTYIDLFGQHDSEMATVTAFLRSQHVRTDAPADWQPHQANPTAGVKDPLAQPPMRDPSAQPTEH